MDEILQLLDDVSASLNNCLVSYGKLMMAEDRNARLALVVRARKLCDEKLRPNNGGELIEDCGTLVLSKQAAEALLDDDQIWQSNPGVYRFTVETLENFNHNTEKAFAYAEGFLAGKGF
jgi:hypothetical protein